VPLWYVPDEQLLQADEEAMEYRPAAQLEQAVAAL
jgi:hypothetical protein